jgi:RNA polymerase sigma-70 factor (ECF subfamily)
MTMDREAAFLELKPMLFSLAYRMLGARADAEDVVQEAYLRWREAADDEIRSPRAYLATVTARLSLDALKSAQRKREVYVGPWLPEPLVGPLGAQSVEMAESLSLAFLHLLESLSPPERIAFLLYEIFEMPYSELASLLETTEANCRQLVTRAKKRIQQKKKRFSVDREQHRNVLEKFLYACASGDPSQLTSLLHQDVVLYSDGGGKVRAALNPIFGAEKVMRFFTGIVKKNALRGYSARLAEVNGEPGAVFYKDGELAQILSLEVGESGQITNIFLIANPDKLPQNAMLKMEKPNNLT